MKKIVSILLFMLVALPLKSAYQPEFSTAGFFHLKNSGREVFSMNPAWRFYKGAMQHAEEVDFNDSTWNVVSLPHGIEYLPTEASGCINYQGEIWYRKHFSVQNELKGKKLFLHFEAIMGKSKIFLNGKLLKEHFGGYLPVVVDITDGVCWNKENVLAVWADNSNDPLFPPGKPQEMLDYTYFGGIYRDCWLVAHNYIFITNPNFENEVAGGGLFVSFDQVSEVSAKIRLKAHLRNASSTGFSGKIVYRLRDKDGKEVASTAQKLYIRKKGACYANHTIDLDKPSLWSPSSPYLYHLEVCVYDGKGQIVDGLRRRIGVRSIEFRGKDGFWLNGKPYGKPLIGANRHQDFAVVGNAVPNSLHWRDAKKLKDAGLEVIRNAHCPQDPAFMDACDELGLFVINNTPGWQFWNDNPIFAERVYSDIRNLVRRDRNHACMWLWEPILNETWYPADFAKTVRSIVDTEYPYPYCYAASDSEARGSENFPVHFAHPAKMLYSKKEEDPKRTYFTREWGDHPDDWLSHNSPSRVARHWGEHPMLVQVKHYAAPDYPMTSLDVLYQQNCQHVGGCLWHSFDHQRGYHPDPFYGGIMDVFRQPKLSYYMFMSQRSPEKNDRVLSETGPMVYIAHQMTPFSGKDVTVFSNCDEVRLTYAKGGKCHLYKKEKKRTGMPSPIITFKDVYDFMTDRNASMAGHGDDIYLMAEGLIDGKVVATHKVEPARRPEKIMLWLDNEGTELEADGSDCVVVVAAITDKKGTIKRLNNSYIQFEIEGEGCILGNQDVQANPALVKWGTAPIVVKSTTNPGEIKIKARVLFEGKQRPLSGELIFNSIPTKKRLIYNKKELHFLHDSQDSNRISDFRSVVVDDAEKEKNRNKLTEVGQQQSDFGERM